jgi:Cu/Ag efflux protein CusF
MDRSINLIATNVTIHNQKYSSNLEWPNLFMIFSITGLEYLF